MDDFHLLQRQKRNKSTTKTLITLKTKEKNPQNKTSARNLQSMDYGILLSIGMGRVGYNDCGITMGSLCRLE